MILRAKSSEDSIKITIELSSGIGMGDSFIAKEGPLLHVERFGASLLGRIMTCLIAAYDRQKTTTRYVEIDYVPSAENGVMSG